MDDEHDDILEDGEIFDEADGYTPLERPTNYSAVGVTTAPNLVQDSESERELQSTSGSDSDSDAQQYRAKKPKVKLKKVPKRAEKDSKSKKYDIWSTRVHEDILSETLTSCDVTRRDRSRNVESYDYTLGVNYSINGERTNNKRSRSDRKNVHLRLGKRDDEKEVDKSKGASRSLLDLIDSANCTEDEFAKDMANKLCEEKEDLVVKIVKVVGKDKAIKVFDEVRRIELDGGMMIMNQSRRRTPGGVFLFLIKHDTELTQEQHGQIFEDEKTKYKEYLKDKKKKRSKQMKAKKAAKTNTSNLPELLTKADLVQKLATKWASKGSDHEDVTNPPPTPETDGHADSGDGMDEVNPITINEPSSSADPREDPRKLEQYSDDFLDVNAGNDMDLF